MTVDLRLAGPAAACWVLTGSALVLPLTITVVITAGLVSVAVLAWVALRASRPAVAATAAAVCGVAAAAGAACVLRISITESAPIAQARGLPVVVVQVTGDPVMLRHSGEVRTPVRVVELDRRPHAPVAAELVAGAEAIGDTVPGQRMALRVRVRPPPDGVGRRLVAARLTAVGDIATVSPAPVWQRWAGRVRARLRLLAARSLPPRAAGLFPGLVLGDTGDLDGELRDHFRAAGLTHLTAVSGSNFAIVCGAVVLSLRMLGASTRSTVALGLLSMLGFVVLVRPTDSVLRAAVMGGIGLAGALAARRASALPALGAAVVVVLLFWPQMALAPGFALSVLATLGLVLWAAPIRQRLIRRGVPEVLAVLLAMTLAAQILTTPLVIAISDRVSLVSLPANLLVSPVVGPISLLGTLAAVIGAIGPPDGPGSLAGELLIRATGPEMWWLVGCADALGGRNWSAPEVPGWQAAIVLTLTGAFGYGVWRAHRPRDPT